MERLDFLWDRSAIPELQSGINHDLIVETFAKTLPEHVRSITGLEGNTATLPEVQTLMAGGRIGGLHPEEAQQVQDTAEAFGWLLEHLNTSPFAWTKNAADTCNALLARRDGQETGTFRIFNLPVFVAGGEQYWPPPADTLEERFQEGVEELEGIDRPDERCLAYFAFAARAQFYMGASVQTALHMMNGMLMETGHHAIAVDLEREPEFTSACRTMYMEGDATQVMQFLASCST